MPDDVAPRSAPPESYIDPDGDLSRTGTAALRALAIYWDQQHERAVDEAGVRLAETARDRALAEGVRREDPFAVEHRARLLVEAGASQAAIELADRFAEAHGISVHSTIAFALPSTDPRKGPLVMRAAALGDTWARIEIGEQALQAHESKGAMDIVTALGLVEAPETEHSIDSLIDIRSAVDDMVSAVQESIASAEADAPVGDVGKATWMRHGTQAIDFALETGRLDDAERYAEIGMRLATDPERVATFTNDDPLLLGRVRKWETVLRTKYGDAEADRRLQQEADAGNVGALLLNAYYAVTEGDDGLPDLTHARPIIERAMTIEPRVGACWNWALQKASHQAQGPDEQHVWLREAVEHAVRTSDAGHHQLLLDVANRFTRIDLRVSEALAERARARGADGAADVLDAVREEQCWKRRSEDSADDIRRRLAESNPVESLDPHAAIVEHRAAAARLLELAGTADPELAAEGAAALRHAFDLATQALEVGSEDEDLVLAAVNKLLVDAVEPARRRTPFDNSIGTRVHHADVIAERPDLARRVFSGESVERALAAAAERHAGNSSRLTAIGLTTGQLSIAAHAVAEMLGYEGEDVAPARQRTGSLAADQLNAALLADPTNARCLNALSQHVEETTEPPIAAFEAAAATGRHDPEKIVHALGRAYVQAGDLDRADEVFAEGGDDAVHAWASNLARRGRPAPEPLAPERWSTPGEPDLCSITPDDVDALVLVADPVDVSALDGDTAGERLRWARPPEVDPLDELGAEPDSPLPGLTRESELDPEPDGPDALGFDGP